MSGLRSLEIINCNLSSGLPDALCQLGSLTYLCLCGAQLFRLPPLACMLGELIATGLSDPGVRGSSFCMHIGVGASSQLS